MGPYEWERSGVYILENGRIVGGNNRHYSTGSYEVSGNEYKSTVHVHYYGPPRTVFSESRQEFEINVVGKLVDDKLIKAEVARPDRPRSVSVIYRMTKRMGLPPIGNPG